MPSRSTLMKLADRVIQLKPSATLAVSAKAQEMRAQGKEVLSLSVGEPDFPTPPHICEAAKKAIDEGFTRYTAVSGIPELRAAAAAYYNTHYGTRAEGEHILISNGGKHALYNAFQSLLSPGDHVLIPAPYWVSYPPMVELTGAKAVIIPTTAEHYYKITIAELEKSLTPKTRMLIINSPSNPTGACYTQAEVNAIAAWAVAHNLVVLADEIYDQLVYDGIVNPSFGPWWQNHPKNFVIINGVAKTFAMTGWRVGYALAHPELIKAMGRLQGQSTSNVCSISQKAALAALTGGLDAVNAMKTAFERRRNLAMGIINTWPKVVCPRPGGAFYVFPDVHQYYTPEMPDSATLCTLLLEKGGLAIVPGGAFGDDNCVRLSYAVSDENLERGLRILEKFLLHT